MSFDAATIPLSLSYYTVPELTPVEAVGSGTPTVASDIPPHREFVGQAAMLDPSFAEQQIGSGRGEVTDRLADRGQRRPDHAGQRGVIEARDR